MYYMIEDMILNYKPEDKDERSLPENDPACGIQWEFFTHRHMRSWHRIVSGRCIEEMDYNTFSHVLNCTKDYSDRAITPAQFKGMAMYAFLLLLMTRRMTIFSEKYPDGEEPKEDRYWAEQFAGRVNWDEDSYYIIDDEWKEAYNSSKKGDIVSQEVSAEDDIRRVAADSVLAQRKTDRAVYGMLRVVRVGKGIFRRHGS